ncbi:hypothetical protein [Sediminimonas sp.]|jgi:hypothetical protein|uniref:hypothetical protein n=1 Tax=Sediminimonas sp. TaxID=2823379 RepID=UPI0025F4A240|nr:hypothetical protein [Sediminimonas sp.]
MVRKGMVLVWLLLAGCDAPSPYFSAVAPVRMTVGGSTFDLRRRGRLVEAVRVNPQYAPRLGPVAARAGVAMARMTGCRVRGLRGDQALILGILDCDAADSGAY